MKLITKFHPPDQDGRKVLPDLSSGNYRPHLLIYGRPEGEYLGVQFMACDDVVEFGSNIEVIVKLPYAKVDYSRLVPGVCFIIKEGKHSVGSGSVKAL